MAFANHRCGGVMIVDDDDDIRDVLAEILREEGYEVACAENGEAAISYLRSRHGQPPQLILLDLMMPVMNGWEFRSRQQADPSLDAIPVVILSGGGNVQQSAADLKAAGYLAKPVKLETLLDVVEHYCQAS